MWIVPVAAIFAQLSMVQDPGSSFDQQVQLLHRREVARDQSRSATGRCEDTEIGISWSTMTDRPSLQTSVNGKQTDVTATHPAAAAFLAAGGAQQAYLVCLFDGTYEATIFRALAVGEEGPIDYSVHKFIFNDSGRIVNVFPLYEVEADQVRRWHRP